MELFRRFVLLIGALILEIGYIKCQGGLAIGLGGADLMVDGPFGEMLNPLLSMATDPQISGTPGMGQQNQLGATHNAASGTIGTMAKNNREANTQGKNANSGGFDVSLFDMLLGPTEQTLHSHDGHVHSAHSHAPSLPKLNVETPTTSETSNPVNSKMQNEAFTELGHVGHLVRIPGKTDRNSMKVSKNTKPAAISSPASSSPSASALSISGAIPPISSLSSSAIAKMLAAMTKTKNKVSAPAMSSQKVSANTASENTASENTASLNTVSANTASENTASAITASENKASSKLPMAADASRKQESTASSTSPAEKQSTKQKEKNPASTLVPKTNKVDSKNNKHTASTATDSGNIIALSSTGESTIVIDPSSISFNPGSGMALEIAALQSALLGRAVDMTGMLPPPFHLPSSSSADTTVTRKDKTVSISNIRDDSVYIPSSRTRATIPSKSVSLSETSSGSIYIPLSKTSSSTGTTTAVASPFGTGPSTKYSGSIHTHIAQIKNTDIDSKTAQTESAGFDSTTAHIQTTGFNSKNNTHTQNAGFDSKTAQTQNSGFDSKTAQTNTGFDSKTAQTNTGFDFKTAQTNTGFDFKTAQTNAGFDSKSSQTNTGFDSKTAHTKNAGFDSKTAKTQNAGFDSKTSQTKTTDYDSKTAQTQNAGFESKTSLIQNAGFDSKTTQTKTTDYDSKTAQTQNAGFDLKTTHIQNTSFDSKTAPTQNAGFDAKFAHTQNAGFDSKTAETINTGMDSKTVHIQNTGFDFKTAQTQNVGFDSKTAQTQNAGLNSITAQTQNTGFDSKTAQTQNTDINAIDIISNKAFTSASDSRYSAYAPNIDGNVVNTQTLNPAKPTNQNFVTESKNIASSSFHIPSSESSTTIESKLSSLVNVSPIESASRVSNKVSLLNTDTSSPHHIHSVRSDSSQLNTQAINTSSRGGAVNSNIPGKPRFSVTDTASKLDSTNKTVHVPRYKTSMSSNSNTRYHGRFSSFVPNSEAVNKNQMKPSMRYNSIMISDSRNGNGNSIKHSDIEANQHAREKVQKEASASDVLYNLGLTSENVKNSQGVSNKNIGTNTNGLSVNLLNENKLTPTSSFGIVGMSDNVLEKSSGSLANVVGVVNVRSNMDAGLETTSEVDLTTRGIGTDKESTLGQNKPTLSVDKYTSVHFGRTGKTETLAAGRTLQDGSVEKTQAMISSINKPIAYTNASSNGMSSDETSSKSFSKIDSYSEKPSDVVLSLSISSPDTAVRTSDKYIGSLNPQSISRISGAKSQTHLDNLASSSLNFANSAKEKSKINNVVVGVTTSNATENENSNITSGSYASDIKSSASSSVATFESGIGVSGQDNILHVQDLTADGIYPFEGSFVAREATIEEGANIITDMNRAIITSVKGSSETLHMEPVSSEWLGNSEAVNMPGNNNIQGSSQFARSTGTFYETPKLSSSMPRIASKETGYLNTGSSTSSTTSTNILTSSSEQINRNIYDPIDPANKADVLSIKELKVNQPIVVGGAEFVNSQTDTTLRSSSSFTAATSNELPGLSKSSNMVVSKAAVSMIDSINKGDTILDNNIKSVPNRKETSGSEIKFNYNIDKQTSPLYTNIAGIATRKTNNTNKLISNNNIASTSNSLKEITSAELNNIKDGSVIIGESMGGNTNINIKQNKQSNLISDAAKAVRLTGSNGAPITNMDGVRLPGRPARTKLRKGVSSTLSAKNIIADKNFMSPTAHPNATGITVPSKPWSIPTDSFVIGAGLPNSKVINTGSVAKISTQRSNYPIQSLGGVLSGMGGGFAIGAMSPNQNAGLSIAANAEAVKDTSSKMTDTRQEGKIKTFAFDMSRSVPSSKESSINKPIKPLSDISVVIPKHEVRSKTDFNAGLFVDKRQTSPFIPSSSAIIQKENIETHITKTTGSEIPKLNVQPLALSVTTADNSLSDVQTGSSSVYGAAQHSGNKPTQHINILNLVADKSKSKTDLTKPFSGSVAKKPANNQKIIDTSTSVSTSFTRFRDVNNKPSPKNPLFGYSGTTGFVVIPNKSSPGVPATILDSSKAVDLTIQSGGKAVNPNNSEGLFIRSKMAATSDKTSVVMKPFVEPQIPASQGTPASAVNTDARSQMFFSVGMSSTLPKEKPVSQQKSASPSAKNTVVNQRINTKDTSFISFGHGKLPERVFPIDISSGSLLRTDTNSQTTTSAETPLRSQMPSSISLSRFARPIVGQLFGSTNTAGTPSSLTDIYLQKSGITRTPSVDFMQLFLNNAAQPAIQTKRGIETVQVVPLSRNFDLNSRMTKITSGGKPNNPASVNILSAADKFGIADIYTRQQKLNPTQWRDFMSSVSRDSIRNRQNDIYKTQNVVGTGETRPLNTNGITNPKPVNPTPVNPTENNVADQLNKLRLVQIAQQELLKQQRGTGRQNKGNDFTSFEAPGMSGHKSVSVNSRRVITPIAVENVVSSGSQTQHIQTMPETTFQYSGRQALASQTGPFQHALKSQLERIGVPIFGGQPGGGSATVKQPGQGGVTVARQAQGSAPRQNKGPSSFFLGKSIFVGDTIPRSSLASGALRDKTIALQASKETNSLPSGLFIGQPTILQKERNLGISQTSGSQTVSQTNRNVLLPSGGEATRFTSGSRMALFGGSTTGTGGRTLGTGSTTLTSSNSTVSAAVPAYACRYIADNTSKYHFIMTVGKQRHRFRCALGTAFDTATCECSKRVTDSGDCLEVHMDFNNGIVEDSSFNKLPIGNQNVEVTNKSTPLTGIALFGGDSKLTVWRYQNFDFRDHIMVKVQFRPGPGGDRYQPLITNCDSGVDGPSVGIVYDSRLKEVNLLLKTDNDTNKQLNFSINPDEWNDVTYIYDGQEFIGIVNGVRRYVSRHDPHLLGIIGGEIKSLTTRGLIEIRDAAIVLGHCPKYGYFRGAMVDIQIYTCIPKDFRLE